MSEGRHGATQSPEQGDLATMRAKEHTRMPIFDASGTLLRHMLSATCRKSWWCPDENTENRQPSSSSRGNMPKQTPQTFFWE
eukprot:2507122-Amphidinium_carterae.1